MGLQIPRSPVRSRSHPRLLVSLVGQDTWFSPRRPGFKSRTRNHTRGHGAIGSASDSSLGVRVPLASAVDPDLCLTRRRSWVQLPEPVSKPTTKGGLAQSEERMLCKHEAPGSKPGFSTHTRLLWRNGQRIGLLIRRLRVRLMDHHHNTTAIWRSGSALGS